MNYALPSQNRMNKVQKTNVIITPAIEFDYRWCFYSKLETKPQNEYY